VDLGTPVLAALDGQVMKVVDNHDKYGPTEDFKDDLNYITIRHANGEYSQPAHLEKGSALVKVGDSVHTGQQIGITGNSEWMTEPHLHLLIFKLDPNPPGFKGLKIKFK
jgi:murein DD-endopeptidase MepM/ murein hydrolase activator NlpD